MDPFLKDLSYGSVGPDVMRLQYFLAAMKVGDYIPTGIFGPKTKLGVMRFQYENNITPTSGYFGPLTRQKANAIIANKNQNLLFKVAVASLGTDASPDDIAPDEYGCAETINAIHKKAFGYEIGGGVSTYALYNCMLDSSRFTQVDVPQPGDIVISPTGYGNGKLPNGHVGIVGLGGSIMSNNSATGLFESNYTILTWIDRYQKRGGYPVVFFRRI